MSKIKDTKLASSGSDYILVRTDTPFEDYENNWEQKREFIL